MKFIDVVAASIAAYNASQKQMISGDGMIYSVPDRPVYQWSNKSLVLTHLKNKFPECNFDIRITVDQKPFKLVVTDETYAEAERIIEVISSSYVMSLLSGERINSFTEQICKAVEARDAFDLATLRHKIGMLVYIPHIAAGIDRKNTKQEKEQDFVVSQHLGKIKDKLELDITVFNAVFSQQWNRHYIKAHTSENNVVFFSSNHAWQQNAQYRIRARVKQLDVNNQPGQPQYAVTRLSHVKIID